ncbi:ATP-binding cassette domain-containing protein [Lachnospiraceae bacterium 38-14]|jgi:putative ABC transport system ATP-binding protein|uniref:ABC transporter ATP-binding protein n=1 Tax=Roseburia sp. 1XD42-69 TaxID=2320088 RepID=UPI000EA267CF|nr:ATP-binding cassette domain-containing protein [Roseburia sp. 1XD42-69]RKJ68258.1 ATP-binding cassette domain-containing protein [Roseburia sp. 1XD42-69]
MIELNNVNKKYGDKVLFSNYNLHIAKGEFVVISGESGSGKTTLLNMIGALERIDSGQITVEGIDIMRRRNQLSYYRNTVGFLFQNFVLLEEKTVYQNLNMIRKGNRSTISIQEALEKVGMSDFVNAKVYTLSGGEQQRIALARLMVKKCDLILADEPTGSLDEKNAKKVMSILKQMNEKGTTIILVTHSEELKQQGGRVIEL